MSISNAWSSHLWLVKMSILVGEIPNISWKITQPAVSQSPVLIKSLASSPHHSFRCFHWTPHGFLNFLKWSPKTIQNYWLLLELVHKNWTWSSPGTHHLPASVPKVLVAPQAKAKSWRPWSRWVSPSPPRPRRRRSGRRRRHPARRSPWRRRPRLRIFSMIRLGENEGVFLLEIDDVFLSKHVDINKLCGSRASVDDPWCIAAMKRAGLNNSKNRANLRGAQDWADSSNWKIVWSILFQSFLITTTACMKKLKCVLQQTIDYWCCSKSTSLLKYSSKQINQSGRLEDYIPLLVDVILRVVKQWYMVTWSP